MSSENPIFKDIFKSENEIPEEYKVAEIHQRVYLLNGELVEWNGDVTEIYSPSASRQKTDWKENYWEASRTLRRRMQWTFWKPP